MHMPTCVLHYVCVQQERADGYADKALFTGLPETRPATARKGQRQSRSSSNPEPKGGLQALLQVVTWVSGRAVPYLPTRSAALRRHFCPRATHRPFTLETKYHWGIAPRRARTGALRQLTKGKHKRTCNCRCLLWKLLRLFPGRWWAVLPCKCEHLHLGG